MRRSETILQMGGILSGGVGIVSKLAMHPNPSVISHQLRISDSRYRECFKKLIAQGFLLVNELNKDEKHSEDSYIVVLDPLKYHVETVGDSFPLLPESGLVPRLVMQDNQIDVRDKAVYAYISATHFVMDEGVIESHLGISRQELKHSIRKLEDSGYITQTSGCIRLKL